MKTLGEFYREKILSREDLITRELPSNFGEIKIDRDLFGWKLYSGKNFIECRSEEEARYMKILFEAGFNEVYIPKDDLYLKSILPELETLKKKIDEIINDYLETVMSRKIRERVRYGVYMEIIK